MSIKVLAVLTAKNKQTKKPFDLYGQPWKHHGACGCSLPSCYSEHVLRLKGQCKSTRLPPWTYLILIS